MGLNEDHKKLRDEMAEGHGEDRYILDRIQKTVAKGGFRAGFDAAYDLQAKRIAELENLKKFSDDRIERDKHRVELVKTLEKEKADLVAENLKYRREMDKINDGIPSEWAYAILQKERDALNARVAELEVGRDELKSISERNGDNWIKYLNKSTELIAKIEKLKEILVFVSNNPNVAQGAAQQMLINMEQEAKAAQEGGT